MTENRPTEVYNPFWPTPYFVDPRERAAFDAMQVAELCRQRDGRESTEYARALVQASEVIARVVPNASRHRRGPFDEIDDAERERERTKASGLRDLWRSIAAVPESVSQVSWHVSPESVHAMSMSRREVFEHKSERAQMIARIERAVAEQLALLDRLIPFWSHIRGEV